MRVYLPSSLSLVYLPLYSVSRGGSGRGLGTWAHTSGRAPPVTSSPARLVAPLWAPHKRYGFLHPVFGALGAHRASKMEPFWAPFSDFFGKPRNLDFGDPSHTLGRSGTPKWHPFRMHFQDFLQDTFGTPLETTLKLLGAHWESKRRPRGDTEMTMSHGASFFTSWIYKGCQ